MRMRRKPWCRPELEACTFNIKSPSELKGKWHEWFKNNNPLYIELGCGKGGFISQVAVDNPEINFLAIDMISEMLGLAKRNIEQSYAKHNLKIDNIKIFIQNIEQIDSVFSENDVIDRIYINFCNPWPRKKHKKRRLTHPRQLQKYKVFLKKDGEIWFKTDNDNLFDESVLYFQECGFTIRYITRDLHNSGFNENYITEHEIMFTDEGIPTKFLIAVKN